MQIMTQYDLQAEETAGEAIHIIFICMYQFLKQNLSCCNKVAMPPLTGIQIISNDGAVMVLFQQCSFQQRFWQWADPFSISLITRICHVQTYRERRAHVDFTRSNWRWILDCIVIGILLGQCSTGHDMHTAQVHEQYQDSTCKVLQSW